MRTFRVSRTASSVWSRRFTTSASRAGGSRSRSCAAWHTSADSMISGFRQEAFASSRGWRIGGRHRPLPKETLKSGLAAARRAAGQRCADGHMHADSRAVGRGQVDARWALSRIGCAKRGFTARRFCSTNNARPSSIAATPSGWTFRNSHEKRPSEGHEGRARARCPPASSAISFERRSKTTTCASC